MSELLLKDLWTRDSLERLVKYRATRKGEKATQLIPILRSLLGFPRVEHLIAALAVLPQGAFFQRDALVTLLNHFDEDGLEESLDPDRIEPPANYARSRAMRTFVAEWVRERNPNRKGQWRYAAYNDFHLTVANSHKITAEIPDYTAIAFAGVTNRLQNSRRHPTLYADRIRMIDWRDCARELSPDTPVKDILEGKFLIPMTIIERMN